MKRSVILLPLVLILAISARTQVTSPQKEYNWSLSLVSGASFYTGDVEINEIFAFTDNNRELQFINGVQMANRLSPAFSWDLKLIKGNISGSKWESETYFKSRIFEADLRMKLNFLNVCCKKPHPGLTPYLAIGLGTINWSTELYNFRKEDLAPGNAEPIAEGNKLTIPLALGINYQINERFSAIAEADFHFASSNKIDGVETGEQKDKYGYLTAGITYHFGNPVKAATMKFTRKKEKTGSLVNIPMEVSGPLEKDLAKKEIINYLAGIDEEILKTEEESGGEDVWKDVVFKVQVLASHSRQNIYRFAKKNNIIARIDEHRQDNLFKYTIGEFSEYRKALDYKSELMKKTKLKDAFVVAYSNDSQLSLHELMAGKRGNITEFNPTKKNIDGIVFSVQVFATKNLKMSVAEFQQKYNLREETRIQQLEDSYQIVSGYFTDYKDARNYRREIIEKGLPDAFIVAFKNGSRISLKNAFEEKKGIVHD